MKRLFSVVGVCAFGVAPLLAGPTNGAGWDGGMASWARVYYQGRGGEFTLYPSTLGSLLLSNSQYAGSTRDQAGTGSFQTFCVETDEFVDSNMRIWVSQAFVNTQPGSHAWNGGANSTTGDDLGSRTAYLYQQFARGTLDGYVYAATGSHPVTIGSNTYDFSRAETAGVLQRVIWALEGEGGYDGSGWANDLMGVIFDRQAEKDLAIYWYSGMTLPSGWTGIGDVRVLQLYKGTDGLKQDQLYLTPVPGAVLLGLLGLGAASLRLRKFA